MTTGAKIGASFVFVLAVIMALGGSAYVSTQRLLEANRWVSHTHQVLERLEHVLSGGEKGARGEKGGRKRCQGAKKVPGGEKGARNQWR